MDRGRDRLLELTSHKPDLARELISEIESNERTSELQRFTDNLFDRLGIHTEEGSENSLILKPSENLVTGNCLSSMTAGLPAPSSATQPLPETIFIS